MKYMGSKSRIAKEIVPIIQSYITDKTQAYVEPFVGGANIIDKINFHNKVGYDKSKYLIALLNHAKTNGEFPIDITKEEYSKVRTSYNNKTNEYNNTEKGIYGFLGSCKGRFFDGGYSGTRIGKDGKTRNYYDEAKRNLLKQTPQLKDIKFIHTETYKNLGFSDCVIYCDPPYKDTKQYDTSKGFNHDEFWQWARDMSKNNIVIVSELQAPEDFVSIWSQELKLSMENIKTKYQVENLFIHNSLQ